MSLARRSPADPHVFRPPEGSPRVALGRRGWALVGLVWLGFGLLESLKAYVMRGLQGSPAEWPSVLVGNLPWWLFWGLLTPAIFALARRWPLVGGRALRGVAVHLPASFLFALVHLSVVAVLFHRTNALPDTPLGRMWLNWFNAFIFLELFTYWTVVAAWHALAHYRLFRERQEAAARLELEQEKLEKEMARARLHALQMELQPHFLFNTFNAITALVRRHENREAVEMLVRLGELLRLTLERGGTPLVPLDDELALVRCYLGIQQVRFPDLAVEIEIEGDAGQALVPTLVLQPLVENAVSHGLAGEGRGTIRIRGSRVNGRLTVEVEDSGAGLQAAGKAPGSAPAGQGVGLSNTRARLEALWGAEARVGVGPAPGRGTRVTIELPARTTAEPGTDEPVVDERTVDARVTDEPVADESRSARRRPPAVEMP
jgi:signal transduction histidine kinase